MIIHQRRRRGCQNKQGDFQTNLIRTKLWQVRFLHFRVFPTRPIRSTFLDVFAFPRFLGFNIYVFLYKCQWQIRSTFLDVFAFSLVKIIENMLNIGDAKHTKPHISYKCRWPIRSTFLDVFASPLVQKLQNICETIGRANNRKPYLYINADSQSARRFSM